MLQGAAPVLWLNRSEAFYRSVSARLSGLAAVRKRGRVAGGGGDRRWERRRLAPGGKAPAAALAFR